MQTITYLGCLNCGFVFLPKTPNELFDKMIETQKLCPKCGLKLQMFDLQIEET